MPQTAWDALLGNKRNDTRFQVPPLYKASVRDGTSEKVVFPTLFEHLGFANSSSLVYNHMVSRSRTLIHALFLAPSSLRILMLLLLEYCWTEFGVVSFRMTFYINSPLSQTTLSRLLSTLVFRSTTFTHTHTKRLLDALSSRLHQISRKKLRGQLSKSFFTALITPNESTLHTSRVSSLTQTKKML